MEKISVIMSVYKEEEIWLKESIESILNQTYKNIEYIIILDNPLAKNLENIIKDYAKNDKRIKFYKNKENLGLVKSLNFALSKSSGKYIARMDADDISMPERLEKQLNYLKINNIDILGSNILEFYENEKERSVSLPLNNIDIKNKILITNRIIHPTWLVNKKVYDELNGYRNIPYCEDYDFILRAIKNDFKVENYPEILLKYRLSPNSISRSNPLKQKLISIYLAKNIDCIDDITNEKIEEYIKSKKITERKIKHYNEAIKLFDKYKKNKNKLFILLASMKSKLFFETEVVHRLKYIINNKSI